jgi:hypothetical protein
LLQGRDKKQYSSYSQAVITAIIELLKEPEAKEMPPELIFKEQILPELSAAVERTVEKTIERMLPSFLAGFMACAGSMNLVKPEPLQLEPGKAEEEETADTGIDFEFLGLD